jgi:hypothetical protein
MLFFDNCNPLFIVIDIDNDILLLSPPLSISLHPATFSSVCLF